MQDVKPAPLPTKYRELMLSPAMVACKKAVVPLIRLVNDYCAIVLSLFLAIAIRERVLPLFFEFPTFPKVGDVYIYIVVPAAFIFFLQFDGLYKLPCTPFDGQYKQMVNCTLREVLRKCQNTVQNLKWKQLNV